jgi:ubiquinone biosynthesis protein Coq4
MFWATTKAIFYGLDWGFNPTKTQSAIRAAEIFLSNQKDHSTIQKLIDNNFKESDTFAWDEFQRDMTNDWDLELFLQEYPQDSLGYEFAVFMKNLGYKTLKLNLSDNVPVEVRSVIDLSVRNHDVIHLLFGLYNTSSDGKLSIDDYHEWIFLFYTLLTIPSSKSTVLINFLLFPSQIKAFFTFRYSDFQKARKIGAAMSVAQNVNQTWLKPYLAQPIEQVRKELGIITLAEIVV